MIDEAKLDAEVKKLLEILYKKRFNKLEEVDLNRLLKKNPYLFRSIGLNDPTHLIEAMLDAFLSSSDETLFGNDFFEPLAFWVAKYANSTTLEKREAVTVGAASGTDLSIETATTYYAIAVKSGTNTFNSQSTKGQSLEFVDLKARLRKIRKEIRTIKGYGYGRLKSLKTSKEEKFAGQALWKLLTGEDDFHIRISDSIGKVSVAHRDDYLVGYKQTKNRILRQLMINFVEENGELNWTKIVAFNSSIERPAKLKDAV